MYPLLETFRNMWGHLTSMYIGLGLLWEEGWTNSFFPAQYLIITINLAKDTREKQDSKLFLYKHVILACFIGKS